MPLEAPVMMTRWECCAALMRSGAELLSAAVLPRDADQVFQHQHHFRVGGHHGRRSEIAAVHHQRWRSLDVIGIAQLARASDSGFDLRGIVGGAPARGVY